MVVEQNVSIKKYNTFGMDVQAESLAIISSTKDVQAILENYKPPYFILGGGSNILFTQDVKGFVLLNKIMGKRIVYKDDEKALIAVGAGENWHEFVLWALENGFSGIENLSLIPGTVGASPIQNIGAYGVELKDVFESLEAVNLATGEVENFEQEDCEFGYRDSIFKREAKGEYFITKVFFKLNTKATINVSYGAIQQVLDNKNTTKPTPKDVSDAVISIRQSKLPDPAELGNAGSFFKNPTIPQKQFLALQERFPNIISYELPNENVKVPAGWLIEQCGWKGKRVGNTGAHAQQSLVLVNYGDANGLEINQLSLDILQSVETRFGIKLEREVNVI